MTDPEPIFYPDQEDADWIRDIDDDDLSMSWDEHLHPRGRAGRFARKFKLDGPKVTRADIHEPSPEKKAEAAEIIAHAKLVVEQREALMPQLVSTNTRIKDILEKYTGRDSGWNGRIEIMGERDEGGAVGQKNWDCHLSLWIGAVDLNGGRAQEYGGKVARRKINLDSPPPPGAKSNEPTVEQQHAAAYVSSVAIQLHEQFHALSGLVETDAAQDKANAQWTLSDYPAWEEGLVEMLTRINLRAVTTRLDRDDKVIDDDDLRNWAVTAYLNAQASPGPLRHPYTPMVKFNQRMAKAAGMKQGEFGRLLLGKGMMKNDGEPHEYRPRIDAALTAIMANAEKGDLSAYDFVDLMSMPDGSPASEGHDANDLVEEGVRTKRLTNEWWEKTFGETWSQSMVNWYNKKWRGKVTTIDDILGRNGVWSYRLYDKDDGKRGPLFGPVVE
jgi:hypothetical protein